MIQKERLQTLPYLFGPEVGMAFQVGKLPYAVLIDREGVIRAKGLVNSREHLESLAVAEETGYGSIQAYLRGRDLSQSLERSGAPPGGPSPTPREPATIERVEEERIS